MNFIKDVTAIAGGTLIEPIGVTRYTDEPLVLLVHLPHDSTGLLQLQPVSTEGNVYPKMNPFIRRWEGFTELENALPELIVRMIEDEQINPDTPVYVCTESKAAAILAAQSANTTLRMQTPFVIRSTPQ